MKRSPNNQLQKEEVSFTELSTKVSIYRSPVANAANFDRWAILANIFSKKAFFLLS